jgi:hypothetical protein
LPDRNTVVIYKNVDRKEKRVNNFFSVSGKELKLEGILSTENMVGPWEDISRILLHKVVVSLLNATGCVFGRCKWFFVYRYDAP